MRLVAIALAFVVGLSVAACHAGDPAADNLKAAQGFLILNGKQPDVITLPSGLEYKVVHSGPVEGAHPGPGDEMKVNYEGKLLNGMVFDSSFARGEPADLPLDGLVPGWMQALPMMRPGDECPAGARLWRARRRRHPAQQPADLPHPAAGRAAAPRGHGVRPRPAHEEARA